jgi:hypothetical protein
MSIKIRSLSQLFGYSTVESGRRASETKVVLDKKNSIVSDDAVAIAPSLSATAEKLRDEERLSSQAKDTDGSSLVDKSQKKEIIKAKIQNGSYKQPSSADLAQVLDRELFIT